MGNRIFHIKWGTHRFVSKQSKDLFLYNGSILSTHQQSGCYITTSTYGSFDAPEVLCLRQYRDNVLLASWIGRLFIETYYRISPSIAMMMQGKYHFNLIIRSILDKFVEGFVKKEVVNLYFSKENNQSIHVNSISKNTR